MKKIDHATATASKEFTEGNPATGTPATRLEAQWLNVLQAEIANVILETGATLDQTGADTEQLIDAINALILASASAIDYSTNAQSNAGSEDDVALTPDNFGSQQLMSALGYQKFPGGLILQWGLSTEGAAVTFPVAFPTACYGVVGT